MDEKVNHSDVKGVHGFSERSLSHFPTLIQQLLRVKLAAARANFDAHIINRQELEQIQQGMNRWQSSDSSKCIADVYQGGGGIAVHLNFSAQLSEISGVPQEKLNASQSTADVLSTALRLAVRTQLDALKRSVDNCAAELREVAIRLGDAPTLSRTCLQDAVPTAAGARFLAFAELLQRRSNMLATIKNDISYVNLGGTVVGTGSGAPLAYRESVLKHLASECDLTINSRSNLIDAAQNSDDLGQLGAELGLLCRSLIKFTKDLRLLGSGPRGGFNELLLPKTMPGSSYFSNKNNPVVVESLLQAAILGLGTEATLAAAQEHAELDLNVFEPLMGFQLLETLPGLTCAISNFTLHCLRGLKLNAAHCQELSTLQSEERWNPS